MKQGEKKVLFNGRTLIMTVTVNTDEDAKLVAERVHQAACGPLQRMAMTQVEGEMGGEDGTNFWNSIIQGQPS